MKKTARPAHSPRGWLRIACLLAGLVFWGGASLKGAEASKKQRVPRYFIALDLIEETRETLAVVQSELARSKALVAWTRPGGFHVTLRYLGEQSETSLKDLSKRLPQVAAEVSPFTLRVKGLGSFPYFKSKHPRVLWAGLMDPKSQLIGLAERVEKAVIASGNPPSKYPIRPHITLGRAEKKGGMAPLSQVIQRLKKADLGSFPVQRIVLYEILPENSPQDYRVQEVFPLGSAP